MAEVYAGFVCGYGIALFLTPTLAIALIKLRSSSALLARMLPVGTSATGLAVILHLGLFFVCTGMGIILGMVLFAMDGGASAFGSANAVFTLFVFGTVLAIVAPLFVLLPPLRVMTAANAIAAILIFGWLMPYMARWAP